jgi:hypothetical protein
VPILEHQSFNFMRNPIIRTIYLYLFALIGLGMLVVGASMLINIGLKTWIFTRADQVDVYNQPMPLYLKDPSVASVEDLKICADKCQLTKIQKEQIANWLIDYENWQENEKNRGADYYLIRNRERQASTAISLILVGLPLWLFHWAIIKKDLRNKKEEIINS